MPSWLTHTVYVVYKLSYDFGATTPEAIIAGVFNDRRTADKLAKKIDGEVVESYLK